MADPASAAKPGDAVGAPGMGLFQGYGVEIEYMIVDGASLDVRPVADRLMEAVAGDAVSEVERDDMAWSNELALHVLEFKTNGPAPSLAGLHLRFHREVLEAETHLASLGCRLLPGGAHPWMDPDRETRLWPHEHTQVYRTFDRIFSCRGHGWSNLQSTHLNLPFSGDREFGALHGAIRAVLPLIPALAASTPVLDGRVQPELDARLSRYAGNAERVPSVTGQVVPEAVPSEEAYRRTILDRIYRDMAPLDPEGVLRHEWVNARGAIARFDRSAVEVRVVDTQECPWADLGVAALYTEVVRRATLLALEDPGPFHALETDELAAVLAGTIQDGEASRVGSPRLLELLGLPPGPLRSAGEIWRELAEGIGRGPGEPLEEWAVPLGVILEEGPLARRLLRVLGKQPSPSRLRTTWEALADALRQNRPFRP
jgi:glutamate---cysteine ligase / carboxylate-amine ligase